MSRDCGLCCLWLAAIGCAAESKDAAERDIIGPYKTWNEVISGGSGDVCPICTSNSGRLISTLMSWTTE